MDVSALTKAISNLKPICRDRKATTAKEEDSMASKRAQFYAHYFRHQKFSLPDSIIYYITMKPATPKGYQSIIQTCKYFFIKNPIIFLSNSVWDAKAKKLRVNGKWYDSKNLSKYCSKFWVVNQFTAYSCPIKNQCNISNIISKFYRFDAKCLFIRNLIILYSDFVYLSSAAEDIHFIDVTVIDENGSIVALEKIVEAASKAVSVTILSAAILKNVTSKTAKELSANPYFSMLKYFGLNCIPDTFDIETFYAYMKKNKYTKFDLNFDATISDAYKSRLNVIIDEILETENINYKIPRIYYPGMNFEKYNKLNSIFYEL